MAEEKDFDPAAEGQKIARNYLSKLGWARQWRRSLNTQLYPAVQREEFEAKERQVDRLEEEAEIYFSGEYERWRHDPSAQGKDVLRCIYNVLRQRTDLGFFGKRIIARLKQEFTAD